MKTKLFILAACAALFSIGIATAATVGDPMSFSKYGVQFIPAFDGGSNAKCVGISKQNSVMIRNWINDGGTASTIYCGFDTSVNQNTGMPVQANETLTVDIVALQSTARESGSDSLTDGGVTIITGPIQNQVCCMSLTNATDEHWMIVK